MTKKKTSTPPDPRKIRFFFSETQKVAMRFLLDKLTRFVLFGGGANGGKSALGCIFLISMCIMFPGTRWFMARKELKKLKETTLRTFFKMCRRYKISTSLFDYNAQNGIITWWNGAEILLLDLAYLPSDPDFERFGSFEFTGGIIDEAAEVAFKAFDVLKSRVGRQLNEEYDIFPKIFLSVNPSKSWVYREFYRPWKEGKLLETHAFVPSLWSDNCFRDKGSEDALKQIKDPNMRARLLLGDWEFNDDPTALFSQTGVADIFCSDGDQTNNTGYISCDPAGRGEDRAVIMRWLGYRIAEIVVFDKSTTVQISERIKTMAKDHKIARSNIVIDSDGLGFGVASEIEGCRHFVNNAAPIQPKQAKKDSLYRLQFRSLKAQCYFELAQHVDNHDVSAKCATEEQRDLITEELAAIKQKTLVEENKIDILPKETIKDVLGRSPDFADCMAMRFIFDVLPQVNFVFAKI